jgi:hypothetical protein
MYVYKIILVSYSSILLIKLIKIFNHNYLILYWIRIEFTDYVKNYMQLSHVSDSSYADQLLTICVRFAGVKICWL